MLSIFYILTFWNLISFHFFIKYLSSNRIIIFLSMLNSYPWKIKCLSQKSPYQRKIEEPSIFSNCNFFLACINKLSPLLLFKCICQYPGSRLNCVQAANSHKNLDSWLYWVIAQGEHLNFFYCSVVITYYCIVLNKVILSNQTITNNWILLLHLLCTTN